MYAQGTTVEVAKTRAEIEKLVKRQGATAFGSLWGQHASSVFFQCRGRHLRFVVPMPDEKQFREPRKRDAEERRLWRCLLLAIKSKFEAVSSGIAVFDEEFLGHIVIPGSDRTVAEHVGPALIEAYERGAARGPLMLPPAGSP